jgi:hypothetical protein
VRELWVRGVSTLIPLGVFMVIWITNVGQVVHHTPDPNWLERLGRS